MERKDMTEQDLAILAQELRIQVLDLLHEKGTGHWGGASSVADLLCHLYFNRMNIRPEEPSWEKRDRLILSKGHASAMLYAVLARRGYFPESALNGFREIDSMLQGHPCMNKTPGVEMSTGALGHGLSVGLGMAMAAKMSGNPYWTYVIVGEGCLNEGQSWEAIMAAAKYSPKRLVLLVDFNRYQLDGSCEEIMPLEPLLDKFRSFSWICPERHYNGHDHLDIAEAFRWLDQQDKGPIVIVFDTKKGKGISFTEDTHAWHGAPITDEVYAKARPELEAGLERAEGKR